MTGLLRELGARDGAALVITNVVGAGIFLTPGIIAGMVPDPGALLGLWLLGGVLALVGALSYAELAARRPLAGGEYVYISEAFGPLAGFLSGWTSFVAGFSGAIAAAAVGFAAYLGRFVPVAGATEPIIGLSLGPWTPGLSPRAAVALLVIAVFTLVHLTGLATGGAVQTALAGLNVLTILLLVVAGFGVGGGDWRPGAEVLTPAPQGHWLVALVLVMFTYSGWNAAAYVAGEIRDPSRALPRALSAGTAIVIVLYLLLNALYLSALGPAALAGEPAVGEAAAAVLFGPTGNAIFTSLVLLALASSVSAMVIAGPRVYYAMSRDGVLPPLFGSVTPVHRVPAAAIVLQGVWSGLLVLSGAFEALLTYTGFAVVLFAGAAVAGLFVIRRRDRGSPRPYSAWGYPFAPAAFVLMSLAMVVQAIRHAPVPSLAGVLVIGSGVPVYLIMRARERHGRQNDATS